MLESIAKNVAKDGARALGRRSETAVAKVAKQEAKAVSTQAADTLVRQEVRTTRAAAALTNPTVANKVTFHVDAEASHQALLSSIANAKESYYIETFIWHNDDKGREVIEALAKRIQRAKAEGKPFDAKVIIDWFGLRQGTGGQGDKAIPDMLRAVGVDVKEFSQGYIKDGMITPITHRKLHIQDGTHFITGGRNIGDEYLAATYKHPSGRTDLAWHDLFYTVEGTETGRIRDEFFKNWERAGGTTPTNLAPVLPARGGSAKVQTVVTNPHTKTYSLRQAHSELIAKAEKEIVLIYPYFSDDKLIDQLIAAKKKNPNLSIKVMLPSAREASKEGGIYELLNKESARQLIDHGIEIRMFGGGVVKGQQVERFSHFKGMAVDGQILSIGSANGDARTYKNNHELNTLIQDPSAVADFFRQVITPDWNSAKPLTQADLKQSFMTRVKQTLLEWFDFLL